MGWPLEARRSLFPDWLWLCDESSPQRDITMEFWQLLNYWYTRDLPGVALVITFFMALFTVHKKSNFLLELPFH